MESCEIRLQEQDSVVVVSVKGYFTEEAGEKARKQLLPFLKAGKNQVVMDFSACDLVNSPGVASLLELAMTIKEDFLGTFVLSSITALMEEVFSMAGVLALATVTSDLSEGVRRANGKR